MKELIKNFKNFSLGLTGDIKSSVITQISVGILGVMFSRAAVNGALLPFGISILAAVPCYYIPAAAIGSFLGYFFPAISGGGFRYIASLLAVLTVRLLLSGFKSVGKSAFFSSLIAFLSLAVTAPAVNGKSPAELAAETLLAAGGTFFLKAAFKGIKHRKSGFSPEELSAFLVSFSIFLCSIGTLKFFGIHLYIILGVFLILSAAKFGGPSVSVGAGISAALAVFLTNRDISVSLVLVIVGLCAGGFKVYGKWVISLVGIAASLVGQAVADNSLHPAFLIETVAGAALFLCLPKGSGAVIGKYLSFYPAVTVQSDLKKLIKIKLLDAADALSDVKNTVNEVSNRLSVINAPDFSGMMGEIENTACSGCKLRIHCWESRKGQTADAVTAVIEADKKGESNPLEFIGDEFKTRCLKSGSFVSNVRSVYGKYSKSLAVENRAKEVRDVVSEQFEGISLMLKETADEISRAERFDRGFALSAASALKNLDIIPSEAVCRIDKFGRKQIKIKAASDKDTVINKMQILKAAQNALECDFSPPLVTVKDKDIFITLNEAERYTVETGAYQISAGGNSMCGDSYKIFTDGSGRFFAVLSDGMGTGGAAAVDSALSSGLVTRLIKSGIGLDSALKIINSSMLFKSTNESTATLDIVCTDLFTGQTEIYKAGAAPTVIKRGYKTVAVSGKSLPIGILSDVHFDKATVKLRAGDTVVMMSDGASGDGIEWIKREAELSGETSAECLAESIALAARRRRSDGHEDDITVLTFKILRAQ